MVYAEDELVRRVKLILKEIKQFPTDSREIKLDEAPSMREVPYWSGILDQIENSGRSLQDFYDKHIPPSIFEENKVPFPSPEQEDATAQMLENYRLLIRDGAGAGKTAPFIQAKLGLEQLVEKERVNTVVVCPNYVLSSWGAKLREYLTFKPEVLTITSKTREEGILEFEKGIGDGSLDFTLISYDALFRELKNGTRDEAIRESTSVSSSRNNELMPSNLSSALLETLEGSSHKFMLGLDECHHIKNPKALRSEATRNLALASDFFYPMTGSPFPDNLEDIGELASLLDPGNYPTAEDFNKAYEKNPKLIRLFLRRFSKEPVVEFSKLPEAPKITINEPTWLDMSLAEQELSWEILEEKEFNAGAKYALLRLAATNPRALLPENYNHGKMKSKLKSF